MGKITSGYGYGYGYGSGSGDGYGSGYGSGDGSGYGSGDGYGSGYGYGSGDGYGDGDGYGYGYGDGSGYGSSDPVFIKALIDSLVLEADSLRDKGIYLALWRSGKDGLPSNGGHSTPAHGGKVEEIPGPLELCTKNALHATLAPEKWKGERLWIVALHPPVKVAADKLGALKREILKEIPNFYA